MRKLFSVLVFSLVMIFSVSFPVFSAEIGIIKIDMEMLDAEIISAYPSAIKFMINDSFDDMVLRLKNETGPMVGIGIAVQFNEQEIEIVKVYKDTPAEIVGMREGDKITAINGKIFSSSEEFVKEIRSSSVPMRILKIDFIRGNTEMTVNTKARILRDDKTSEAQVLSDKIKKEGNPFLMKAQAAIDLVSSNPSSDNKQFAVDAQNVISSFWNWYLESYKAVDDLFSIK